VATQAPGWTGTGGSNPIRILLVDDQPLFRRAIAALIHEQPEFTVVGEASNGLEAIERAKALAPDLIVIDVSFIGLAKVLPAIAACAAATFDLLALVKPQFEVGRERVGKGGVVRGAGDRLEALVAVGDAARHTGMSVQGYCSSGLPGPAGNRESFVWCTEAAREGVHDLVAAARHAEPA